MSPKDETTRNEDNVGTSLGSSIPGATGMENDQLAPKDAADIREKHKANLLQAISIAATFVVAVAGLVIGARAHGKASTAQENAANVQSAVQFSRVETEVLTTNSLGRDAASTWQQWSSDVSTTTYVGIQRRIQFHKQFDRVPKVGAAFSLINVIPFTDLFDRKQTQKFTDRTRNGLRYAHTVIFTTDVSESGFVIQVGIGLPTEAARVLRKTLETQTPDPSIVNLQRQFLKLPTGTDKLNPDQVWTLNFFQDVGAFDVLWISQADQGTPASGT